MPKPRDEVQGLLKRVSLVNFLQLIEIGGDTCLLEVHQDGGESTGHLYIYQGMLYNASLNSLYGADAAIEMLKWDQVTILIQDLPDQNLTRKIDKSLAALILAVQSEEKLADDSLNAESPGNGLENPDNEIPESVQMASSPQSNLKSTLEKMAGEMDGMIVSGIISIENGELLEQVSNRDDIDPGSAAVFLAKVVQANREALKLMGNNRPPEDILVTTKDNFFIIRQLPGDANFLFVMTVRDEWIGRTRVQMAAYAEELATALDLV